MLLYAYSNFFCITKINILSLNYKLLYYLILLLYLSFIVDFCQKYLPSERILGSEEGHFSLLEEG